MPKNQFQRPLPVRHTTNVPRHGTPLPKRKIEAKRDRHGRQENTLPSLETLLTRSLRP